MIRRILRQSVRVALVAGVACVVVVAQSPQRPRDPQGPALDFDKVNAGRMLIDSYSYWAQPYSYYYFHHMDKVPKQRLDWVRKPAAAFALKEPAAPFDASYTVNGRTWPLDDYLTQADITGFLILKDNQILYEKYLHGATRDDRFVSFSMEKSITSVLVGVAIDEGLIKSVDDPVTQYLPDLKDTAYKNVTLKNLLQMASGIRYDEMYQNADSDIHRVVWAWIRGDESFHAIAKSFGMREPERAPGTQFDYQSIDTQVLTEVLVAATKAKYHEYAEAKLWKKIGAESDAFIFQSEKQPETCGFGCYDATGRDWARFALMAMNDGQLGGTRVVSEKWMRESTTAPAFSNGYGYQWWLNANSPDRAFRAVGIYGQTIYINPVKHVAIVQLSARPTPSGGGGRGGPPTPFDAIAEKVSQ